ncbi:MAG TPA: hypothetical protein VJ692_04105 [Nitrospiraceae bacterium]|nr:hypothetical protein [Nitrospiraceae bacterium]
MDRWRRGSTLLFLFGLILTACSSVAAPRPPAPSSQAPSAGFASPASVVSQDSHTAKAFRSLAREQEGRLAACVQDRSCDRAHFTRALLYLSENQDLAEKHFQEVVALAPKSPLASLSVSWLKLLKDDPSDRRRGAVLAQTTQWLIQDLWTREQGLKEELSMRGKRLEELSAQLEALKQIDVEMNEKPHPMQPKSKPNPRTVPQN